MKIKLYILPLAILLMLFSCTENRWDSIECEYFEEVIFERKVNFQNMVDDVMLHYGGHSSSYDEFAEILEEGREVAKDYTIYGIKYRTVDHEAKPIIASGLIYYPETFRKKGVLEIVPVNKSRQSCGTINKSVPEAIAGCTGYIMIVPDLLGCGETSDYPISYVQHDNVARVSADMRKAAYEFLYNERYTLLLNEDYLFGYSLGGSGVLALARYYKQHPERGVKVKELWIGAGAYEPSTTVDLVLQKKEQWYAFLPNMLYSLNWYDKLGLDLSTVFVGEMKDNYMELANGDVPIDTLSNHFGSSLDAYMNLDFFKEDNEDWKKVHKALEEKNIPIDFKPDFPVYLYHSVDDTTIPHDLSDSLYARLTRAGGKVNYVKTTGTHHGTGFKIEGDMARHLLKL